MKQSLRGGLLFLFAAYTVWGQADANKAQVVGTVVDPNNAVVPNAKVTIRNTGTGFSREAATGAEGQYRFVLLDAGRYEVSCTSAGFATATITDITLNVGSSVGIDIRLQLQATSTSIDVAETLINIVQPAPSTVINMRAIADLPINGRRFQDFATLTPTVQVDPSRGQLSFAGQRGINGNIMVDGADYNQPFFGGIRGGERSNFNFTIPQSAVQEFQAISSGYSAEYGRSSGGVLNVITKGGSNEVHGDAFYQNRNRSLSADNPVFMVQPSESLQQLGGSVGGPVKKDSLFFFGAAEYQRANTPAQVVFTALQGVTVNANNKEAYDFAKSLEQPFTRQNQASAFTAKLDWQSAKGNRLTVRYNHSRSDEPNSVTVGGALNPFTNGALSTEGTESNRTHFGTIQYTHLFSPQVVNDLKFSQSYEIRPRTANSNSPAVSMGPIGSYGTRSFLPTVQDDWRTQITDSLSVMAGKHTLKLGVDYSGLSTVQTFGFNQFGAFSFNTSDNSLILDIMGRGGAVANRFDHPLVIYRRQVGDTIADYGMRQMAVFAQDSWRVTGKLTVDLGLRWEGQYNPEVAANNTALLSRVDGIRVPNGGTLQAMKIRDSLGQVAPRIGFAWSPFHMQRRFVVRGHGGIFYAASPMLIFSGPTNNFRTPPGDVSIQIGPFATSSTTTVYTLLRGAGVDLNPAELGALPVTTIEQIQRAGAAAAGVTSVDPMLNASLTLMAPNFRNPKAYHYGIGMESELAANWVAGLQYQEVKTMWLERNRDWNMPVPAIRAADGRPVFNRALRPIPTQATFSVRESSARSEYRALVVSTHYRSRKFQAGLGYILSTNYSDDDNERDSGGVVHENSYNLKPEWNYSNLDARHGFNAHALYSLPLGIEVSGILRARSGLPLNPIVGSDTNGDSYNTDRPYQALGVPFLRNSFRNRAVINDDLRIMKSIKLRGETMKLQLSAEFFNLLNVENVIYSAQANIYGLGISNTTGQPVAIDSRFMLLKNAQGLYNQPTTSQLGSPFQAQFGVRLFF